jgi:hypothetical protein
MEEGEEKQISYKINKFQFTDPNYMSCTKPSETIYQIKKILNFN